MMHLNEKRDPKKWELCDATDCETPKKDINRLNIRICDYKKGTALLPTLKARKLPRIPHHAGRMSCSMEVQF